MNKIYEKYLVSPTTYAPVYFRNENQLGNETECFSVIESVPVMLETDVVPDWHRELIEVILWQYPDEIRKMYDELDFRQPPQKILEVYIKWVRKLLGGKEGIRNAFERYANSETDKWIVQYGNERMEDFLANFKHFATVETGRKRTETKAAGIWEWYNVFTRMVLESRPKVMLELATGAGGGTAAIAWKKPKDSLLFTVDIGFDCLGNAVGIGKYLDSEDTILLVCANFWKLPFAGESMDLVCTYCGLDESRENTRTLSEVSRVLKYGGKFVCVSRTNAYMRQASILEPFGFTEAETIALLKQCRLYSDAETLIVCCEEQMLRLEKQEKVVDLDDGTVFQYLTFVKE